MKKFFILVSVFGCLIVVLLATLILIEVSNSDIGQEWEYKVLTEPGTFMEDDILVDIEKLENFHTDSKVSKFSFYDKYFNGGALYNLDGDEPKYVGDLQKLGEQGWELVAVCPVIETAYPNFGADQTNLIGRKTNVRTKMVNYIFKRKKQ